MNEPELPLLTPESLTPALNPILVTNGAGLDKLKQYFERKSSKETRPVLAIDYETNITPTFHTRRARTLQIGDRDEQYVIDFLHFAQSTEALISGQGKFETPSWATEIVNVIKPVFDGNHFLKVGQNLSFEYEQSLYNLGVPLWGLYSVDLAEKVIQAGLHSFKDLAFFSLAAMTARHFGLRLDKTEQKNFDLETPLTQSQIEYACLDLRMPLAIRNKQLPVLEESGLVRVTEIENDAIPYFSDLHLSGIKTDKDKWAALVAEWTEKYQDAIQRLDTHFIPVVGPKNVPDVDMPSLLLKWKENTVDSPEELAIKAAIKGTKDKAEKEKLRADLAPLVAERKKRAADARKRYGAIGSQMTAAKKVFNDCEGEAAINYGSQAQLKKAFLSMKGFDLGNLPDTGDDTLKKFTNKPAVTALREYRTYGKLLDTYGTAWYREYSEKPSNENGWVNPVTGRIHARINQLEAETGRTSSEKPNLQNVPKDPRLRASFVASPGNKIVSVDMAGAELRIIAEESGSKQWIEAFNNDWDVHSVGTETLYPVEWPAATESGCAYFEKDHKKCKCPKHIELRDDNKSVNFLLAYGGDENTMHEQTGKPKEECAKLMAKHRAANPEVWAYLDESGKEAARNFESRSLCGRRRLFKRPSREAARELAKERMLERLKKKNQHILSNSQGSRKLTVDDMYPTDNDIRWALTSMSRRIERQGKNLKPQSLNATIAKLAFGAGFDERGRPYLWHLLPALGAKPINMVHDEAVLEVSEENAEKLLESVKDCIRRAGSEFLKSVVMEADGRILDYWSK